jgi:hypothetical protein
MADQVERGLSLRGEKHNMAKLSEADVHDIRAALAAGERQITIAAHYDVTSSMISRIKKGLAWWWLKEKK